MNGDQVTKAALNKIKAVSGATSSTANGQKKRKKGQDLKPIITRDGPGAGKAQRYALTDFCRFFFYHPFYISLRHFFIISRFPFFPFSFFPFSPFPFPLSPFPFFFSLFFPSLSCRSPSLTSPHSFFFPLY